MGSSDAADRGRSSGCAHPWLRVTCGVCAVPVDAVDLTGPGPTDAAAASPEPRRPADDGTTLFIVARGHPDLLDQIKTLLGPDGEVRVIADRRQVSRWGPGIEEAAAARRAELRRRVMADEESG